MITAIVRFCDLTPNDRDLALVHLQRAGAVDLELATELVPRMVRFQVVSRARLLEGLASTSTVQLVEGLWFE